jgi:Na+-translocating ferredoxin:NAD+ oxidoreductase RNF subunit RnfB
MLAVVSLGAIGAIGATVLYFVSQAFYVEEDPRIEKVQEALPAANCGGCGYPGCSGFADACVKAENLDGLFCPVGGVDTMKKVAEILGKEALAKDPTIAVVRCNGTCENRPRTNFYDGASNCSIASSLYGGDTGCSYGCLGHGDCVKACTFDAIRINPATLLPEVDEEKCTSCGACVKSCPKLLIQLRKKGPKSRRIYVGCMNKEKGAVARKACNVSCIACSKCQKICSFEAITIENNLAYISDDKCRLCRKCVDVCPTSSIIELNFPPKKEKPLVAEESTVS